MGILRVFFALVVLLSHAPASYHLLPIFSGPLAVEAFYIISGFYIQLIIGKYASKPNGILSFYSSRLARIFSTYFFILLCTIAYRVSVGNYPLYTLFKYGNGLSILFGLLTNILIFGQDVARMLSLDTHSGVIHLVPSGNMSSHELPFGGFAILNQSWTLALELMFYVLSPLILKARTITIAIIAVSSLYLKCTLEQNGVIWTMTFFPCELGYFLLGVVGCRAYERFLRNTTSSMLTILPAFALSAAIVYLSIVWAKIPAHFHYALDDRCQRLIYMLTLAISLPFIFHSSRTSKLDRAIGELSYPIYLLHILVIEMLSFWKVDPGYIAVLALLLSVTVSIPIARYVEEPISRYRHRRFLKDDCLNPHY